MKRILKETLIFWAFLSPIYIVNMIYGSTAAYWTIAFVCIPVYHIGYRRAFNKK